MPQYDFQVQLEKNASMVLKNPVDGSDLKSLRVAGHIMKGCAGSSTAISSAVDTGLRAYASDPHAKGFRTLYSFGDFYVDDIGRPLSMKQNPNYEDAGVEIRDDPANEFPKTQYWSMYAIFTLDLPNFQDPRFRIFHLANRREAPIRLRCRLTKPWGEEIPLHYELLDTEIPLYPWDFSKSNFSSVCPITGGTPQPLAALRRDGDQTTMRAAWTAATGRWNT